MIEKEFNKCPECGEMFDNVFDAIDHTMEEGDEFDPALILGNGYRLMIGSLLRAIYDGADNKDYIKELSQDTFVTLYMAEFSPLEMKGIVHDIIVENSMVGLDEELKQLLKDGDE